MSSKVYTNDNYYTSITIIIYYNITTELIHNM